MIGNKVTLSFWVVLVGLCGFVIWLSPIVYINQPAAPMKMSAGRSIIRMTMLGLLFTFVETNFAPVYHSGVWYISFD